MLTFQDLKNFALEPLVKLYEVLVDEMDQNSIDILKNTLYDFGIAFKLSIPQKTIYTDRENVHSMVSSTTRVARRLINDYAGLEYRRPLELSVYDGFFNMIESETYHAFDSKLFFMSLWNFITNSKYKDDMIRRFKEELEDSEGLCMTGYIVRMLNSIRGFGYEQYEIKLDPYEYERAKMFNIFNNELKSFAFDSRAMIGRLKHLLNSNKIVLSDKYGMDILRSYTGVNWSKNGSVFDFNE